MKFYLLAIYHLFYLESLICQKIKYYEHIKPIIDKHCIQCHSKDGVAPFSFETYDLLKTNATMIKHVINTNYMPPWKADTTFQKYANVRGLSLEEKRLLEDWINGNFPKGKLRKKTKKHSIKSEIEPDLIIKMNKYYTLKSDGDDDFRFFYINEKTPQEKYINKIEFVPGNKKKVHHSRIMIDTSGRMAGLDGLSELDPEVYKYQTIPLANEFFYGWVPGNFPFSFGENTGIKLPKSSNFIFNMHYSPNFEEAVVDSSYLKIYYLKNEIKKEIKHFILRENNISNQPFLIKANEIRKFYMTSGVLKDDYLMKTIQPHAHLLCKDFRSFAITPEGEVIPFVNIPEWDFNWQETYHFKTALFVPKGSVIYAEATYDNTDKNPQNYFSPPIDISYGWRTVNEMMNVIFTYEVER
jgi:hypothetical protein